MWNSMRSRVVAGALGLALALVAASPAGAVTYEDSFDQCNYPKGFDLAVMRPISFGTMIFGTILFVPVLPIAAATAPREIGDVWDFMVGESARFTFRRQLGECTGVDLSY